MLDHGDAPDSAKICAREVGSDQVGGLGTHIIRDVMDSVAYQSSPNRETYSSLPSTCGGKHDHFDS